MTLRLIETLLSNAKTYKAVMRWLLRDGGNVYLANLVEASPGQRVLDIGCGPSVILDYLTNVQYTGIDMSEKYINNAKEKYGDRATFYCTSVDELPHLDDRKFDRVLLLGVQHHLSNDQLNLLMKSIPSLLAPGGRVITHDPVLTKRQNLITRILIGLDRGRYVRNQDGYQRFIPPSLAIRGSHIKTDMLRLPYSILFQDLELTR